MSEPAAAQKRVSLRIRRSFFLWVMELGLLASLCTYVAWAYFLSGQPLDKAPVLLQLALLLLLHFSTIPLQKEARDG